MNILVGCPLPEQALNELRSLATDVEYAPGISTEDLEKRIADVTVLIVCRARVSPEVIAAGKRLQLIVRSGTNTDNIAISDASAAGIFVANCPYADATAVAELAFGLLIALDRRIFENASALREGRLEEPRAADACGLAGRTLGLLGFGPVEHEILERAQGFMMEVIAWAPVLTPEYAAASGVGYCSWPRELARQSDMVMAYAPPQPKEELVIGAEFFENMRDGAYFVYLGHPAALDQKALVQAAEQKRLRVAYDISGPQLPGSDAGRFQSRLESLPGVIGTHHLADRTQQAQAATAAVVVRVVHEFLVAGETLNCVNLAERSPATWQLILRLRDTVGVLAAVVDNIRADGINIEEVSTRVFTGARAGCCRIALDERPSNEVLTAIRGLPGVLHLDLRAIV